MKIAELLAEAEFMEKRRMIEMEAERLHIQEKVVKAQAKFKIYENLDQMSQEARKIEVQEDKGNSEHQLKHIKTVADKTKYYNKNQQAPASFLDQPNRKAVDDKGKKSDVRKSKYESFDARCMEIKSGSRDFGNLGHQLIFADPKQTDANDVSKSSNDENRSARNSGVSADDTTNILCQLLIQQAAPDVEMTLLMGTRATTSMSPCHMCKKNHDVDNCKKFLELGVNERSSYLAENKLCFRCFDPISSNHSAKTCSKRIICKECKNYHPTALYGYQ